MSLLTSRMSRLSALYSVSLAPFGALPRDRKCHLSSPRNEQNFPIDNFGVTRRLMLSRKSSSGGPYDSCSDDYGKIPASFHHGSHSAAAAAAAAAAAGFGHHAHRLHQDDDDAADDRLDVVGFRRGSPKNNGESAFPTRIFAHQRLHLLANWSGIVPFVRIYPFLFFLHLVAELRYFLPAAYHLTFFHTLRPSYALGTKFRKRSQILRGKCSSGGGENEVIPHTFWQRLRSPLTSRTPSRRRDQPPKTFIAWPSFLTHTHTRREKKELLSHARSSYLIRRRREARTV